MRKIIKALIKFPVLCCLLICLSAQAQQRDFEIEDIELIGARRITLATVLSYIPVKVGDRLSPAMTQDVMRSLYATGFFRDVQISRRGNVLVINVKERPAIAEINIDGNKKLKDKDIDKAFDEVGLVQGRIYNDQVLDMMQRELERLYYGQGKYGVKIKTEVTPLPRNRVKISLDIKEGLTAKIKQIHIVGNNVFSDEDLLDEFELGIPSWYAIFSSRDEYAKTKMADDLEQLRSYYLDRGYIHFNEESTQVTISPDKKDIYITISVSEGEQYSIRNVAVSGSSLVVAKHKDKLLEIANEMNPAEQNFSNKNVTATSDAINKLLGTEGYAFADTRMIPVVDENNKKIDLNFIAEPGQRVYIRKILLRGNDATRDEVYRRELRQLEGAWYSSELIERSKIRLQRLTYVEAVEVDTPAVPGTDDQIDVIYDIKERFSGAFNIGAGYSDYNGVVFTASLTHNNVLGSGNSLSVGLNSSDVVKDFSIEYTNPYVTDEGVSRRINLFSREIDTARTGISNYLLNTNGGVVSYGIPLTEYSAIYLGLGASSTEIVAGTRAADVIWAFLRQQEDHQVLFFPGTSIPLSVSTEVFQITTTANYIYDTRNRSIFPDEGTRQSIALELTTPGSDLEYYKINHNADYYWPIFGKSVFHAKYNIGIGEGLNGLDGLPFFEKYLAGGARSIRGFEPRSIAPEELIAGQTVRNEFTLIPYGGDLLTVGSLEYILPPFSDEFSARMLFFYDFGSVYPELNDFDVSEFRSSAGIALNWLSPLGPMSMNYAKPLKRLDQDDSDDIKRFQFTVGTSF
jgi:outer membrane protein insertion porin family